MEMVLDKGSQIIFDLLQKNGYKVYLVGGCVRDSLLKIEYTDYDFTTNCPIDMLYEIFTGYKINCLNKYLSSIKVYIDNKEYQITTFRKEDEYIDFRHPSKVELSDRIEDDLVRRDFTINALAYNPKEGIIDLFNGQKDLDNRIIRTINDPFLRFSQDPLRILRALRFCSKLDFIIEPKTSIAMKDKRLLIKHLSKERIIDEFNRIIQLDHLQKVFINYKDVFKTIFNELNEVNDYIYKSRIKSISKTNQNFAVRLALFYELFNNYSDILQDYHYPKKIREKVCFLIKNTHLFIQNDEISIKKLLNEYGKENLSDLMYYQKQLELVDEDYFNTFIKNLNEIMINNSCYSLSSLAIKGNDLIDLGYCKEDINHQLNKVLLDVIENRIENNKETIIAQLKKKNH